MFNNRSVIILITITISFYSYCSVLDFENIINNQLLLLKMSLSLRAQYFDEKLGGHAICFIFRN